MIKKSQFL